MAIAGQELAAVPKMCVFWDFETLSWSSNGCQLNPDLTNATETVFTMYSKYRKFRIYTKYIPVQTNTQAPQLVEL